MNKFSDEYIKQQEYTLKIREDYRKELELERNKIYMDESGKRRNNILIAIGLVAATATVTAAFFN